MIRMIQSKSPAQAKAYYTESLAKADYFINDQELSGVFSGKLAERMGLSGEVTRHAFHSLCDNINPKTGEQVTARTTDNRIVGYDISFHAPKSLSILSGLTKDGHLTDAFNDAVGKTMAEVESDTMTRVRKGGHYDDRHTGELIYATFIHQTARPVEGHAPDPHLHAHVYTFNMTYDKVENQYKAAKFREMKRSMPFFQAMFHKHLSDNLIKLGYQVRRSDKSFEIVGVPKVVLDMFSKRTDQIGRAAKEKGIVNAKELAELGARTRSKKQKGLSMAELRNSWKNQIINDGYTENQIDQPALRTKEIRKDNKITTAKCVEFALSHTFERASVKELRRIEEVAIKQAIGNPDVSVPDLKESLANDGRLITITEGKRKVSTTREVLREEKRMIDLAREGNGKHIPLYQIAPELNLDGEQAAAVRHILTTNNRVSIVRGAAGTGKTYLMTEAKKMIQRAGKDIYVVAPTAQASRGVLREDGFKDAETVAKLLNDKELQAKLQNQVLWVDEAGLLGTKDMGDLIHLANQKNVQLVLGGDTRQHTSLVRGDALRILNTVGKIKVAEVTEIKRQKEARYKAAIEDLSKGAILSGFSKLEALGSIKQVDPDRPYEQLVRDYVQSVKSGKSALVVCPTHNQGAQVTLEIREQLRKAKKLGKKEIQFISFAGLSMTLAERQDWRNYKEGNVVQFNQNLKGIKRGSAWEVQKVEQHEIHIKSAEGKIEKLPLHKAKDFDVMEQRQIPLSNGDKVRITKNSLDNKKRELNNGEVYIVRAFDDKTIKIQNPVSKSSFTVKRDFGHLTHAHCITSHSAQGKTVDHVFIAQPAATFGATDAKQFYVSASRGKEKASFYTDDKTGFLEHITDLGDRVSAHELLAYSKHTEAVIAKEREAMKDLPQPDKTKAYTYGSRQFDKERDYEPSI
ncbi:MAG: relaxase domain-containing protein [Bacteroidetes bacterium]|nr:relaxase domain-containing protein [Bacteroidota bacterium]